MKTLAILAVIIGITGCSTSSTQYYEAVAAAAQSNAAASQAKFEALSKIAATGDGQAASAAVMALALTQTPMVQPIPQQSEALQWASILASPVTSLGMMWMQTDSTKKMAEYNSQVDLARISADSTTQQALYGSFVSSNQITGDVATAGMTAMGNVDYTPFVNGMVTLGTSGIDGAVDLGTAGFDSNVAISTVGLNTAGQLGVTGMNNLTNLGAAGMTNLTSLGASGMTAIQTVGTEGFDALNASTAAWLNYSAKRDTTFAGMMATEQSGCIATTNSENQIVVTCN